MGSAHNMLRKGEMIVTGERARVLGEPGEPEAYLHGEQPVPQPYQDVPIDLRLPSLASAHVSPNDWKQALAWFQREADKPFGQAPTESGTWLGWCLVDARMSFSVPPLAKSAWASWLIADDDAKHVTSDLSKAPYGAALISKGSSPFGHIWIAARPFPNGEPAAWSNDLVRHGHLDKVHREAPRDVWSHKIIGWMTEINGYDLRIKENKPPKPKQDKRYKAIAVAINRLEHAREVARKDHDHQDAQHLTQEIRDLKELYAEARHA